MAQGVFVQTSACLERETTAFVARPFAFLDRAMKRLLRSKECDEVLAWVSPRIFQSPSVGETPVCPCARHKIIPAFLRARRDVNPVATGPETGWWPG